MKFFTTLTALLIFGAMACSDPNSPKEPASLVLRNAVIYTLNDSMPWAQAMAITKGRISYVGTEEGVQGFIGKTTQVVDMKKRFVLPGFQDAHVHPEEGMSLTSFMGCDLMILSASEPDPEKWAAEMRKCALMKFPHDWILGGGHNIVDLLRLKRTPRALLDEIFPDKPAAFMEKSSHSFWVNSKALALAGIDRNTPDPQGGIIFKDPKTGEPNGILSDNAGDEIMHLALKKTDILQEARYDALLKAEDYLVEHGITSITNARVYWEQGNYDIWLRAEKEGTLKTRTLLALWAYPNMDDEAQLAKLKSMYGNDKNSLLRSSMVKFYSDGLVQNNSAAVVDKYHYLIYPDSKPFGLNYFTETRLAKYITELERSGFDVHIHAIGDRGVRESLNAIEMAQKANPELKKLRRHQITHIEVCRPNDVPRFGQLGVNANIQINFELSGEVGATDLEHHKVDYEHIDINDPDLYFKILGDIDALFSPVLEIADSGGRVVLSSDWDVASINPLVSIENMATNYKGKRPKDDLIAFAIKAYTLSAAYVMQQDDRTGSLAVGKWADIAVLDQNIFEVPVEQIDEAKVVWTLLGGKEVYRGKGF